MSPLMPDDPFERLSAEDMATRREEEFRAAALARQARGAATVGTPGKCSNCGEACGLSATFCDVECRADWEARRSARLRAGGAA